MNTIKKNWNEYKILFIVSAIGFIFYCLVYFLSFNENRKIILPILDNSPLNDYATVIGGLLGTAVTVIGVAFLIYAYKDQQRQAEFGLFNKLYEDLLNDINSIQYRKIYNSNLSSSDDSELFQGVDALFNYAGDDEADSSVLNHLHLIVVSFKHIEDIVIDSKYYTPKSKDIMLDKIYLLYLSKVYWPSNKISNIYREKIIEHHWGYPRSLFYHLDRMTRNAYFFLDKRKLIFGPSEKSLAYVLAKGQRAEVGEILLTPELRVILNCDYTTPEKYWKNPPKLPLSTFIAALPPSKLNNIITCVLGESAFSDAIIDKLNTGKYLKARRFINWLCTAPGEPSKYPSKRYNKNPRGCWEADTLS